MTTTNQPTDATEYTPPLDRHGNIDFYGVDTEGVDLDQFGRPIKTSRMKFVGDLRHQLNDAKLAIDGYIRDNNTLRHQILVLEAQLAAAKAEAKAWEAWGQGVFSVIHECLMLSREARSPMVYQRDIECGIEWNYKIMDLLGNLVETKQPQPVDASSLARIARVALDYGKQFDNVCACPECRKRNALQPNDITLAQSLIKGMDNA